MHARLALAIMLIFLAGCEAKVTPENYDKIRDGMSLAEVQLILGEGSLEEASGTSLGTGGIPERSSDDIKRQTFVWEEDGKIITVQLVDGIVTSKTKRGF